MQRLDKTTMIVLGVRKLKHYLYNNPLSTINQLLM